MTYLGTHRQGYGKGLLLLLVTQPDGTEGERVFDTKNAKHFKWMQPGSVFSVEAEWQAQKLVVIFTTVKFERDHEDDERRLTWVENDRAARSWLAADRMSKATKDPLHEMLDPIRHQYRKSVGANRAALLAEVVRYVTGT